MSANEYDYATDCDASSVEYDSCDCESDCDSISGETAVTTRTVGSIRAALQAIAEQLEDLDTGIADMATAAHTMEAPVLSVTVATLAQPRELEATPFRATQFRLKEEARRMLGAPTSVLTFAELCGLLRPLFLEKSEALRALLVVEEFPTSFLALLQHLDVFVV
jgi:hypothetical protein